MANSAYARKEATGDTAVSTRRAAANYASKEATGDTAVPTTRVAERVTVNLSQRSSAALEHAASLTGDTKTDVINKALQLFDLVQTAQHAGGGAWIQDTADVEPVRARFY